MLVVVMGNTTLATSTILASFMAGLSLGSYFWGRHVESRPYHPFAVFGFLEIGVGILALLFATLLPYVVPLEAALFEPGRLGPTGQLIARFLFCFCLLVAPTFLMGGTFAAIGKHVIRSHDNFGGQVAWIYGINTAGALIGALFTGFFLIKHLGHSGSIWVAACLNGVIGAIALLSARKSKTAPSVKAPPNTKQGEALSLSLARLILLSLALSGFCSLAYQLLWTRLLILIIDNSVYSFTIILSGFLAGIAFGSLGSAPVVRFVKKPVVFFGLLHVGIAIAAFCFPFFIHKVNRGPEESYLYFLVTTLPLGLLVPTLLMGIAFPVGTALYQRWKNPVGESLGIVYAVNSIGSVLGALAAAYFFINLLGFRISSILLPGINLVVGIAIIATQVNVLKRYACLAAGIALFGIATVVMPPDFFEKKYAQIEPRSKLMYYDEALATTAAVFERPNQIRLLYLNGIPEVDTSRLSVKTFRLMGALPGLLHPDPRNALMITFGAGVTSGMAAHFADRIECVDLASQALEFAPLFAPANERVYENPSFSFVVDDARHFIQTSPEQYSIIISDATHPRVYDSWVLFTAEFYEQVKQRLAADGIFLQWVPYHGLELSQYMGIVRTFSHVFEHTSLWEVDKAYSLLVATPETLAIDFQSFYKKMVRPDIKHSLRQAGLENIFSLLSSFSMAEDQVHAMVAPYPAVMTDNSPAHLFFPFRATFRDQYEQWPQVNYRTTHDHKESIIPYLVNVGDSPAEKEKILSQLEYYEKTGRR